MIKQILKYDINSKKNPSILQEKTNNVIDFSSEETINCIKDLNDTLNDLINKYGKTRGIGLSAPQIGYNLSISAVQLGKDRYVFINPKVINKKGKERLFRIGCFSLYEYRALVKYNDSIVVEYYNEENTKKEISVSGDWALIVQHELDHLEGRLLFDRLPNKEKDLFIPREKIYTTKHVPLKNYGFMVELKRKLKIQKIQTTTQYYSFLFNDSYDYCNYVKNAVLKRKELVDILQKYTPRNGKILEAGCGTSSLSIYLSKNGYNVSCVELNPDMLSLAIKMNESNNGKVKYSKQDITELNFKDDEFDIIYSHGVLEHFDDELLLKALQEGLRVANYYIVSVPTIWDISNSLMGDERLKTIRSWKKIINSKGYKILETIKMYPTTPILKKISKKLKILPSGNVIFVITK